MPRSMRWGRLPFLALAVSLFAGCSASGTPEVEPSREALPVAPVAEHATEDYGPDQTQYERQFAIVVGIDEYDPRASGLEPLKFAVNDARDVHSVLCSEFGFEQQSSLLLLNRAASRAALQESLPSWLRSQHLTRRDALFVFYAGHGIPHDTETYLAAWDTKSDALATTGVSVSWLREAVEQAAGDCLHKVIVLDCCYAGALFTESFFGRQAHAGGLPRLPVGQTRSTQPQHSSGTPDVSVAWDPLSEYFRAPCFLGMSAGRDAPVADGQGVGQHSVFTAAFLQELRDRSDSPRADGAFTFKELARRTETRVRESQGSQQTPLSGHLSTGTGDFVFRPTLRRLTPTQRLQSSLAYAALSNGQQVFDTNDRQKGLLLAARALEGLLPDDEFGQAAIREYLSAGLLRISPRDWLFEAAEPISNAWISPREDLLLTASPKHVARLWKLDTQQELPGNFALGSQVTTAAFSPDSRLLATGQADGRVLLWEAESAASPMELARHVQPIGKLTFSPDGRWLVMATKTQAALVGDCLLQVFDVASRSPWRKPTLLNCGTVSELLFSADGRRMVSVCQNPKVTSTESLNALRLFAGEARPEETQRSDVRLWETGDFGEIARLDHHLDVILKANFDPDSGLLVTYAWGQGIWLWNSTTGELEHSFRQPPQGTDLLVSPLVKEDRPARPRHVENSLFNRVYYQAHSPLMVSSAEYHPGRVASTTGDQFPGVPGSLVLPPQREWRQRLTSITPDEMGVSLWEARQFEPYARRYAGQGFLLLQCVFSETGTRLLSLVKPTSDMPNDAAMLRVLDPGTGTSRETPPLPGVRSLSNLDSRLLGGRNAIDLDVSALPQTKLRQVALATLLASEPLAKLSPDGRHLAVLQFPFFRLRHFRLDGERLEERDDTDLPVSVWSFEFLDRGRKLLVGCHNGQCQEIALDSGHIRQISASAIGPIREIVADPCGRRALVVAGPSLNNADTEIEIQLRTATDFGLVGSPTRFPGSIAFAKFSTDGSRALLGTNRSKQLLLVDSTTGAVLHRWACGVVTAAALSGDGRRVATLNAEGEILVWSVEANAPVSEPLRPEAISQIHLSHDGNCLATYSTIRNTRLWNVTARQPRLIVDQFGHWTQFDPHGPRALLRSDKNVVVVDTHLGIQRCPQLMHPSGVTSARFAPDGRSVVTSCEDGTLFVWHLPAGLVGTPAEVRRQVELRVGSSLDDLNATATLKTRTWQDLRKQLVPAPSNPRPATQPCCAQDETP